MSATAPAVRARRSPAARFAKKAFKRVVPFGVALYLFPKVLAIYVGCGLLDVLRNQHRDLSTLDRYFAGNGFFTWLLSPFNLLMDVLCLPFVNKRVYRLTDLPQAYQDEITAVIDAAHKRNIVEELEARLGENRRGMMFFKWYGKNIQNSVDIPEFHQPYRYIRTIGVSIFNRRESTGKHFGPLRVTYRVLYNINTIDDPNVYIQVGNVTHYWREDKLFIFDDTLQHQSCNDSDGIRYCMFIDILRPSLVPRVTGAILACMMFVLVRVNFLFFRHWTFLK